MEISPNIQSTSSDLFKCYLKDFLAKKGNRIVYSQARLIRGIYRIVFAHHDIAEEYVNFFAKNYSETGTLLQKFISSTIKLDGVEPAWDVNEREAFKKKYKLNHINFLKSKADGNEINIAFAKTSKANADILSTQKYISHLGVAINCSFIDTDDMVYPHCQTCHRWGHWGANCQLVMRCPTCNDQHDEGKCLRIKGDAICCNCGEKHPAFARKCKFFKEYKNRHIKPRITNISLINNSQGSSNEVSEEKMIDVSNKLFKIFEAKFDKLTRNLIDLLSGKIPEITQPTQQNIPSSNKRSIEKINIKKRGNNEWEKVKKGRGDDDNSPLPSVHEVDVTPDGRRVEGASSYALMECCSSCDELTSGGG